MHEPVHDIWALMAYAISEDSSEPAHRHSLVRAFTARKHIDGMEINTQANIYASSPTRRLCMHVQRVIKRKCGKNHFFLNWLVYYVRALRNRNVCMITGILHAKRRIISIEANSVDPDQTARVVAL